MFEFSKRRYIFSLILLLLAISSFVVVTYSWFTTRLEQDIDYEVDMGVVDVELDVYFHDGSTRLMSAEEVEISPGVTKPGVYLVNINNATADDFIENLRVDILVRSNVPTYFRVKLSKQLTLIYTDFLGNVTELSVYMNDDIMRELTLYYDSNWYIDTYETAYYYDINDDIRDSSGNLIYEFVSTGVYTDAATQTEDFYIKSTGNLEDADVDGNLVIRGTNILDSQTEAINFENRYFNYIYFQSEVDTLTTVPLVIEFPESLNFGSYPDGYSLQLGVTVEAVQALNGPENVWDLTTPPWGGEW
ncbi:MAG: hypothetical protein AB7E16_00835 [Candidatus Izemoplasmatales bacterium]|jgi:hypothetical protein